MIAERWIRKNWSAGSNSGKLLSDYFINKNLSVLVTMRT